MKFFASLVLVTLQVIVIISAETVQLEPSQGILIPAPIAHSIRVARASYGSPVASAPAPSSYSAPSPAPSSYSAPAPAQSYGGSSSSYGSAPAPAPAQSYGGSSSSYGSAPAQAQSYGGSSSQSIPAPPCPKNYLFSCQPSLAPVPCAASAPAQSGGSYSSPQGAYSQFIPQYAVPVVRELY